MQIGTQNDTFVLVLTIIGGQKMFVNEIRFTDESKKEDGLRIIILNGPVIFTGRGTYRIPNYIFALLDNQQIPYEIV